MLLRAGKTDDQAIRFFDEIQWQGLNDCRNAIPHLNQAGFPQLMQVAIRKYTEWTAAAAKQIRELVDDPAVAARLRNQAYWVLMGSEPGSMRTYVMLNTEIQEAIDLLH